jgi:glycine/D-amino acid oxidase-like deaminating enzyme
LWLRDGGTPTSRYPRLRGKHETSVAIVGGGITGALVAHAFASAGVPATVLEGARIGRGSTAASSALLLQEPDLELMDLTRRYGLRAARRIWELSRESARDLVALVRRLRIQCDLKKSDAVYYAVDPKGAARLRRELGARTRAGFDAEWLDPRDLRRSTGVDGRGAIRTRGGAQFDPYRACLGVMRAAAAAGAEVFERSEVKRIDADRDRVRIRTAAGVVEAERVIVATGYATARFKPLAGRFRMYRTYVLATEPVPRRARRQLGLSDVMVWDTDRPYHYARWTADRRLLLGGADRRVKPGSRRGQQFAAAAAELRAFFDARSPALTEVETELAWEGLFAMTPDSLPYIGPHRRYPGHWFSLGYGGNGMTFGALAARLLLERWQGAASEDHGLFEFGRTRR